MNWYIKDALKMVMNAVQGAAVSLARLFGIIDFPVPPYSSMSKTSSRNVFHYYNSGLTTYMPIVTAARLYGLSLNKGGNILDFGCGVGRQLLHMTTNYPEAHFFACDVDSTLISFIAKNYPMVKASVTNFTPPLPYDDNCMDLIYSVSTFSHFDLETQQAWLRELFRVTKPGGTCILTTEGWRALEMMQDTFTDDADVKGTLSREGILYKEYNWLKGAQQHKSVSDKTNVARGIHGSYGNTVMTPEFIKENWPHSGFELMGIAEGVIGQRQDLIALRKPTAQLSG